MTDETDSQLATTGRVVQLTVRAPGGPDRQPPLRPRLPSTAGLSPRQRVVTQLTGSAVGAHLIAVVAGLVGADYVGARDFSLVLPLLSGLACAWWVSRVSVDLSRVTRAGLAGGYGAASAAFAFVYSATPYGSVGTWLPPLVAAIVGALAWPLVDPAPPRSASGRVR